MNVAEFEPLVLSFPNDARSASLARRAVTTHLREIGLTDLLVSAELVVSELVTNAVLHTAGPVRVQVRPLPRGVRIEVFDHRSVVPVIPNPSTSAMTGRGLLMVRSLAAQMGFEALQDGKVVWAELRDERLPGDADVNELIEAWADDLGETGRTGRATYLIELGDVPTDLLLAAKSHVDNLVREFTLAAAGAHAGTTSSVPAHLASLIETVVHGFSEARLAIKRQALDAARRGAGYVRLSLELRPEAADAGEAYLQALDQADLYCRASRLLTLETPPEHRAFRHWYVGEIVQQLRRSESGLPPAPPRRFEEYLLGEIRTVAAAWAAADRAARLYSVSSALAGALTVEAVSEAVLTEGAAALGATGGGVLLPAPEDRLLVPGTVGYDDEVVASLRDESPDAELPAAVALRTGEPVWIESRDERDRRFPQLAGFERETISMCAVPLKSGARLLGALRFSFSQQRIFDGDERRFVEALAAQAAQAVDRARLYQDRSQLAHRLQRSLLPPRLPAVAAIDLAAIYHPVGNGMEIGGDFYDVWTLSDDEWCFSVGDVCGKGPEAAALTALVRYSLRAITPGEPDLAAVLSRLNDILLEAGEEERFCTVILGTLRSSESGATVTLATGGHPGPLLERADGQMTALATEGTLIGILPALKVHQLQVELAPGDRLILYTDGVTEARSGSDFFGIGGLMAAVRNAPKLSQAAGQAIEQAVLAHSNGHLTDDLAVLILRHDPSA